MKKCPVCHQEKEIECFGIDRSRKDGRKLRCKPCAHVSERINAQTWRDRHPEVSRERSRANEAKRILRKEVRDQKKAWNLANKHKCAEYRRGTLHRMYKCSVEKYAALLEEQGGGCAICHRTDNDGKAFCIDHDHKCCPEKDRSCGKCIRGLLCTKCNQGIGCLGDEVTRLLKAAEYIDHAARVMIATEVLAGDNQLEVIA